MLVFRLFLFSICQAFSIVESSDGQTADNKKKPFVHLVFSNHLVTYTSACQPYRAHTVSGLRMGPRHRAILIGHNG